MRRADDVLADVHGPVAARHVRDGHVQPLAPGQRGVHERARQVEAPAGRAEHLLDEVAHLGGGEHGGRELGPPAARDEHLRRGVDPDLLDLGVVEVGLERAETRHGVDERAAGGDGVGERRDDAQGAARLVVGDGVAHELVDGGAVAQRVHPAPAHELAHLVLEHADGVRVRGHLEHSPCSAGRFPAGPRKIRRRE